MILPPEALPLLDALAPAFTRPTCRRFLTLLAAAILTTGRRTVANLLRTAAPLAPGHITTYRRVLSSASWSAMRLACGLCRFVLTLLPPDRPIPLVGDDTVDGHPGRRGLRQGPAPRPRPLQPLLHRLAVRPQVGRARPSWSASRSPTRPWALPVLVDLYPL
jgi:DDE superfamily endonuclease